MLYACRDEQWDQEFANNVNFKTSPVVAAPDVTEIPLKDDDEFVVIASDGLWWAASVHGCICLHESSACWVKRRLYYLDCILAGLCAGMS